MPAETLRSKYGYDAPSTIKHPVLHEVVQAFARMEAENRKGNAARLRSLARGSAPRGSQFPARPRKAKRA